jgi:hypothetical chaperone protein
LGHDLAFAVERGKIAANCSETRDARIDLSVISSGLGRDLSRADVAQSLNRFVDSLEEATQETMRLAQVHPDKVNHIIYVGGSSLMSFVESTLRQTLPKADHRFSDVFTAVANGLAIAASR